MSAIGRWKNRDICRNAGMNAEAHHEAIPACETTWKRTRYLIEGAQSIGRIKDALSTGWSESGSELDAALGPEESLEGTLGGCEVFSCVMADV